jgi:uncharacterized protein (DUF2249 family)
MSFGDLEVGSDHRTSIDFAPDQLRSLFRIREVDRYVGGSCEQGPKHGYVEIRRPTRHADTDAVATANAVCSQTVRERMRFLRELLVAQASHPVLEGDVSWPSLDRGGEDVHERARRRGISLQ